MKRFPVLLLVVPSLLLVASCGGGSSSNQPPSKTSHRAFISNTYSGNLQIIDTQDDTTPLTPETTSSTGQLIPGQPVTITVSTSLTFMAENAGLTTTLAYDPVANLLNFVTNSTETASFSVSPTAAPTMALFSPDGSTLYVPERNLPISGERSGGVEFITISTGQISAAYAVPSASAIALSPSGQYLIVFADNSDSIVLIDLKATTITPVGIGGFARPVNAFFSTDSNTAYVLNCGPECGSAGPASVSQFDIPSQTIKATVPVGGASVGLLSGTTLYVAGTPGTAGSYDVVDVGSMTRVTTNSVAIGDGTHTTMALSSNKMLYIGATSCLNQTTGCLSIVDTSNNNAVQGLPPRGPITGMLAINGRNTMYVIQGGYLVIYDTTTNAPQSKQVVFTGSLYTLVQVDQ